MKHDRGCDAITATAIPRAAFALKRELMREPIPEKNEQRRDDQCDRVQGIGNHQSEFWITVISTSMNPRPSAGEIYDDRSFPFFAEERPAESDNRNKYNQKAEKDSLQERCPTDKITPLWKGNILKAAGKSKIRGTAESFRLCSKNGLLSDAARCWRNNCQ